MSYAINLLITGTMPHGSGPTAAPLREAADVRSTYHFLNIGQGALPMDSMG